MAAQVSEVLNWLRTVRQDALLAVVDDDGPTLVGIGTGAFFKIGGFPPVTPTVLATPAAPAGLTPAKFETALAAFVSAVQGLQDHYYAERFPSLASPLIEATQGPKYVRIVKHERNRTAGKIILTDSRSVYCFVEKATGAIYKAAGWKTPAKHARGNILGANPLDGCTTHGAAYLR